MFMFMFMFMYIEMHCRLAVKLFVFHLYIDHLLDLLHILLDGHQARSLYVWWYRFFVQFVIYLLSETSFTFPSLGQGLMNSRLPKPAF